MDQTLQNQTVFHLTGRRPSAGLEPVVAGAVRPALMARYRDLTKLRYDFPLVLVKGPDKEFARSLSSIIDALLKEITRPGIEGEGLRRYALHVEHEIRCNAASGKPEMLSALWKRAVARLTRQAGGAKFVDFLAKAGKALRVDGLVVDCDEQLPVRLIEHAWRSCEERKARGVRAEINTLIARLNDILRADFVRSDAGRKPETLKAGVGTQHQQLIDFNAMSRMLKRSGPSQRLPDARRRRIEWALEVLRSQRFFAAPGNGRAPEAGKEPYGFAFGRGADVITAFRQRLPAMVELVKAMSMAALEADGRYVGAAHDAFFEAFDEGALTERDLGMFPHYLVCLAGGRSQTEQVSLMDLLSSGVPVKVLVQVDDILEESGLGEAHFAVGLRSVQLAAMAVGLTNCFVLQSASSSLPRVRHAVERGLSYAGPALFSVFSPKTAGRDGVPAYLVSAAAMQSRAFPVFTCDPSAGPDLVDRFSLEDNVDPTVDWPVAQLSYADADLQRQAEPLAFTFADFVSCDARHARHFAVVPHAEWSDNMVPVADWLVNPQKAGSDRVPYILTVGPDDVLQRVIVDDKVIQAARRCRENWHRLQELGGVHSSHADRLLKREKAVWEAEKAREIEAIRASAAPAAAPAPDASAVIVTAEARPAVAPAAVQAPEEPARSPDEAYIETPRCSTCNECTLINDQMFAYNENKQAYIKDIKAGSYRQLVEAAESCQVSIIHPGKPRDPSEPGLEELIERAKPFQ